MKCSHCWHGLLAPARACLAQRSAGAAQEPLVPVHPMAGGVSTAACLGDTGPHQGGEGVRTAGGSCVPAGEQWEDMAPAAHCSGSRGEQGALPPPSRLAPKLTPLAARRCSAPGFTYLHPPEPQTFHADLCTKQRFSQDSPCSFLPRLFVHSPGQLGSRL